MTRAVLDPELAFRDAPDRNCAGYPVDTFYPGQGAGMKVMARLRDICATCPHLEPCREYAIIHEYHGFWGGLGQRDRIHERRRRGIALGEDGGRGYGWNRDAPGAGAVLAVMAADMDDVRKPRPVARCGTPSGYRAHRRRDEPPCDDCRLAHNAAKVRQQRERKVA